MRPPKIDSRFLFYTPKKHLFNEKIYIFNAYLLDKYRILEQAFLLLNASVIFPWLEN